MTRDIASPARGRAAGRSPGNPPGRAAASRRPRSAVAVEILDLALERFCDARELLGAGVIAGLLHLQDGGVRDADRAGKLMRADVARQAQRPYAFRALTSLTLCCWCVTLLAVTV